MNMEFLKVGSPPISSSSSPAKNFDFDFKRGRAASSPADSDFDFDFNNGRASPYLSAPSSPKGFGFGSYFFSTPSSPAHPLIGNAFEEFSYTRSPLLQQHQQSPQKSKSKSKPPNNDKKRSSISISPSSWSIFSPKRNSRFVPKPNSEPKLHERGRPSSSNSTKSTKRDTRSLSPERRKWRLKDLLLFRSASEGRASDKDPLKKYSARAHNPANGRWPADHQASPGSRRGPPVSAHELHYKANKAVAEDMRRKSFLPYKQGILGRLAVNPTVHALAHGFGSLAHSRGS